MRAPILRGSALIALVLLACNPKPAPNPTEPKGPSTAQIEAFNLDFMRNAAASECPNEEEDRATADP